uniref:Uncharacterized protein n=1 Tax=Dulem virus 268 TaxID=3145745 RepID=A0AAU8B7L0_9VIRU
MKNTNFNLASIEELNRQITDIIVRYNVSATLTITPKFLDNDSKLRAVVTVIIPCESDHAFDKRYVRYFDSLSVLRVFIDGLYVGIHIR